MTEKSDRMLKMMFLIDECDSLEDEFRSDDGTGPMSILRIFSRNPKGMAIHWCPTSLEIYGTPALPIARAK